MKILNNGIKIIRINVDCDLHLVNIIYEKGIQVNHISLTFEHANDIKFIDFENLNKLFEKIKL